MSKDSNHKLKEQFVQSLKSISDNKWKSLLNTSIENQLNNVIGQFFSSDSQDDKDLAFLTIKSMMLPRTIFEVSDFYDSYNTCESPIEKAMFSALVILGKQNYYHTIHYIRKYKSGSYMGGYDTPSPWTLIIEPQAQMGEHRVDFLLTSTVEDFEVNSKTNVIDFSSGKNIVREKYIDIEHKLIVECDGHDFHERTKEQAKKDKKRDRFLQSFGIQVFHYTGSEIWSDVFSCAKEILDYFVKLTKKT